MANVQFDCLEADTRSALWGINEGVFTQAELNSIMRRDKRNEIVDAARSALANKIYQTDIEDIDYDNDIVAHGWIRRFHGHGANGPKIKTYYTETGGWGDGDTFSSLEECQQAWKELLACRDTHLVVRKDGCRLEIASKSGADAEYIELAVIGAEKRAETTELAKSATRCTLEAVAGQINDEYAVFEDLEKKATLSMLKIGLLMEHAKTELPHGQFKKWAEHNLTIKYRHAHNFRKLAQVFLQAQQIETDQVLQLADPAHSQDALGERLRQMAFDFLGDKTQAELFSEHGIQVRAGKKRDLPGPKVPPEIPDGETAAHLAAKGCWVEIAVQIDRCGLAKETANIHHLRLNELQDLKGVLIDLNAKVDGLIQAG